MKKSPFNIYSNHAYGIIKTHCLTDAAGKCVHKLIKMRNPHGATGYNGPWNDKSDLWTEDYKKQVGFDAARNG